MDNEIDGFERKRAVNLVWSAAGRSDFEPPVLMYDHEGKADLYWNSVIGSVYKHMEWPMLQAFYESFAGRKYQVEKENIFWIALQHVCYEVEAAQRPVFPYLRKEYIIRTLADMNLEKAYLNKDDSLSFRILLGYLQQEAEELEKAAQNKAAEGKAEKTMLIKMPGQCFRVSIRYVHFCMRIPEKNGSSTQSGCRQKYLRRR